MLITFVFCSQLWYLRWGRSQVLKCRYDNSLLLVPKICKVSSLRVGKHWRPTSPKCKKAWLCIWRTRTQNTSCWSRWRWDHGLRQFCLQLIRCLTFIVGQAARKQFSLHHVSCNAPCKLHKRWEFWSHGFLCYFLQANVFQSFQQLHEIMTNEYSMEDQQIIGCPSLEQVISGELFSFAKIPKRRLPVADEPVGCDCSTADYFLERRWQIYFTVFCSFFSDQSSSLITANEELTSRWF